MLPKWCKNNTHFIAMDTDIMDDIILTTLILCCTINIYIYILIYIYIQTDNSTRQTKMKEEEKDHYLQ